MVKKIGIIMTLCLFPMILQCSQNGVTAPNSQNQQTASNSINIISVLPDSQLNDSSTVTFNVTISYVLSSSDSGLIRLSIMDADTFKTSLGLQIITKVAKGSGDYNFNYTTKVIKCGETTILAISLQPLIHGSTWSDYASSSTTINFKN